MTLLCWRCKGVYPMEGWLVARLADGRMYGGGELYRAIHKRCRKHTYLPASTMRNIGRLPIQVARTRGDTILTTK